MKNDLSDILGVSGVGTYAPETFVAPLAPAPKLQLKTAPAAKWSVVKYIPAPGQLPVYTWSRLTAQDIMADIKPFPVVDIIQYSDEEYSELLVDPLVFVAFLPLRYSFPYLILSQWTRQETDYLFSLCKRFDLRFHIVFDRYSFRNSTRPIEELRERYYDVVRKVKTHRGEAFDVAAYSYDKVSSNYFTHGKAREIERKKNLEILFSRTPEQAQEEEALYFELRKREQTATRWTRERNLVLDLIGNHELPPKESDKKKKGRRLDARDPDAPPAPPRRDRNLFGVYLRSTKMVPAKVNVQQKLANTLSELGIPLRPTMATEAVMKKNDELRTGVLSLLEVKKQIERLDHEIKVDALARVNIQVLKSEDPDSIGYAARRTSGSSVCISHY